LVGHPFGGGRQKNDPFWPAFFCVGGENVWHEQVGVSNTGLLDEISKGSKNGANGIQPLKTAKSTRFFKKGKKR